MTQDNTGGAAWMREQAAVAIGKFLMTKTDTDVEKVCDAEEAIRAIPLPTNAELLAEAMKLPEVQALVAATRRQVENVERWLETGTPAGPDESKTIYDAMTSALAPFTTAKETP